MDSILSSVGLSTRGDGMLKNFSVNEFALIAGSYKHLFKEQLRQPTADNNHIVNYNLKLQNYLIVNSSIHMISSGMFTFLVKGLVGNAIDRVTINYLGQKRGFYAQIVIYVLTFYMSFSTLNQSKRLNVNHLINSRDYNGDVMMNLVLKFFPHKVNHEKFRQTQMDKYESQILKMTNYEQMMGAPQQEHYKMTSPEAIQAYMGQQQQQQTQPNALPLHPGMQGVLGNQQQVPQQQNMPQQQHAQDAHMKKVIASQTATAAPIVPTQANNPTEQVADLQNQRQRIVDQMRESQQKSPYLSTNAVVGQAPAASAQTSPYFSVSQEISKGGSRYADGMQNYYDQNIGSGQTVEQQQPQQQGYKYQGHYYNIAQQAKKDSS